VQALAFSRDGLWLVSIGRHPERSVVIWDVLRGEAVAVGRTDKQLEAVAWRHGSTAPEFVTVGGDGALLWTLEPTHLSQRVLSIPEVRASSRNWSCA
jgi:WD repeat-containing protein 90